MFTGIIESVATVKTVTHSGTNLDIWLESSISSQLKIDQSIAHNGICLTVVDIAGSTYRVTAVAETIAKTNLASWKPGTRINLERSLRVGDRLDGHFVQGHVDTTGVCLEKHLLEGSWLFKFSFPSSFAGLMIEKGSICVNGVSLTAFHVEKDSFTVTIIPYTYEHTGFGHLKEKDVVNLEFDVLGKYLLRQQQLQ
jgi:riboflavin synthase